MRLTETSFGGNRTNLLPYDRSLPPRGEAWTPDMCLHCWTILLLLHLQITSSSRAILGALPPGYLYIFYKSPSCAIIHIQTLSREAHFKSLRSSSLKHNSLLSLRRRILLGPVLLPRLTQLPQLLIEPAFIVLPQLLPRPIPHRGTVHPC